MKNPYEELLFLLKNSVKKEELIYKAVMLKGNRCKRGEITLERSDLLFLDHVTVSEGDSVILFKVGEEYLVLGKLV